MAKINRLWTKDEVDLLYLWASDLPLERIATRLNRSQCSVKSKACHLRLRLRPEVNNLSVYEVSKILGCSYKSLLYCIKKGLLKAKRANPSSPKSQWRINRFSLKKFYMANPELKVFQDASHESIEWLISEL